MDDQTRSQPLVLKPLKIGELRVQSAKLEQIASKLRERDSTVFRMCEDAIKRSDKTRASIYANEMVRIRALIKNISQSQLAIECIVIRVENFIELNSLMVDLKPLSKMIQSLAGQVSRVMPEIAIELDQLNTLVSETLTETSVDISQPVLESAFSAISPGSEEILNEVAQQVEQELMENLPEPPSFAATPSPAFTSQMLVEAVPVSYETRSSMDQSKQASASEVSQADNANHLVDDFLQVLDDLSAKTRAKLEECMA